MAWLVTSSALIDVVVGDVPDPAPTGTDVPCAARSAGESRFGSRERSLAPSLCRRVGGGWLPPSIERSPRSRPCARHCRSVTTNSLTRDAATLNTR
jgi:hypothetical protein